MTPDTVTVEINNWAQYNPRGDVKQSSWFRLEHAMVTNHKFYDFSHEEFKAWIYILSLASSGNTARVLLIYDHAMRNVRLSRRGIDSAIEKLIRNDALKESATHQSRERDAENTHANATRRYGTIRNETTQIHAECFSKFWEKYPRKIAKSDARARFERLFGPEGGGDPLIEAVERFRAHHEERGTEARFIPYPATFLGTKEIPRWKDWLDAENGKSDIVAAGEFRGMTDILSAAEKGGHA